MNLVRGKLYRVTGNRIDSLSSPVRFYKAKFISPEKTMLLDNTHDKGLVLEKGMLVLYLGDFLATEENNEGIFFPTFLYGKQIISSLRNARPTYHFYDFEEVS